MKRIHQAYVTSLVLLTLVVSACGGPDPVTPGPTPPQPPPPPANNTLSGTVLFPPGSNVAATGTVVRACVLVGQTCDPQQSVATTTTDTGAFSLQVVPGVAYSLFAFKDINFNNTRDDGDYEGQTATPVTAPVNNLSVLMNVVQTGDTPTPPPPPPPTGQGELSGTVLAPPGGDVQGSLIAACFLETDAQGALRCNIDSPNTRIMTLNTAGSSVPFTFTDLNAGQYGVFAEKDVNNNNQFDAGDYSGCYGDAQGCFAVTPPQSNLSIQLTVEGGSDTPPTPGSISGMLIFPGGDVSVERPDQAASELFQGTDFFDLSPAQQDVSGDFVPGEVIVKYKPGARSLSLRATGEALTLVRRLALPQTELLRRADLTKRETLALVAELERQPDVLYAQPNYLKYALKAPNDRYYGAQWHYPAMNLPAAWDIQDGTTNPVTVAVVDTGFVAHPDMEGIFVGGYDFVSDPANSADGDGRDADATDLGQDSGYHGTHVAGTIGARSNNELGVAGVNWGARVVPVRVLGVTGGGTTADIVDGLLWAGGEPVNEAPANPNPAKVINLSLGGEGPCDSLEQEAYTTLRARGVISVVAAGNSDDDAGFHSPANCQDVITVGATGPQGTRAPYSNYGTTVDVMAPGGDVSQTFEFEGESYPAGVLSPLQDDAGEFFYGFYQGTSMASPHVAGLVSLMLAADPALTFDTILARLRDSATPLSADECNRDAGTDCGAGLVDAAGALGGGAAPPPPPPPPTGNVTTLVAAFYCATTPCASAEDFDLARSGEATVEVTGNQVPFTVADLEPGTYLAAAWQDLNEDAEVTDGEPFGVYATLVNLGAGQSATGITIELEPYRASAGATADLGASFKNLLSAKAEQRYLEGDFGSLKEALLETTP